MAAVLPYSSAVNPLKTPYDFEEDDSFEADEDPSFTPEPVADQSLPIPAVEPKQRPSTAPRRQKRKLDEETPWGQASREAKRRYDAEKEFTCPYDGCPKVFNRNSKLEDHINTHTGDRPFRCEECDLSYRKRTGLNHHIKSKHSTDRPWKCQRDKCGKAFTTKQKLQFHEDGHVKQNRHRCTGYPPCEQHFRKAATLQRHIDRDHLRKSIRRQPPAEPSLDEIETAAASSSARKRHVCPEQDCNEAFQRKSDVTTHLITMHEYGNVYVCGMTNVSDWKGLEGVPQHSCGAVFSKRVALENHIRAQQDPPSPQVATKKKSSDIESNPIFKCIGCTQHFVADSDLADHLKAKHQMDPDDIEEILMEQEANQGGRFWLGPPDEQTFFFKSDEDVATEALLLARGDGDGEAVDGGCIDPALLQN